MKYRLLEKIICGFCRKNSFLTETQFNLGSSAFLTYLNSVIQHNRTIYVSSHGLHYKNNKLIGEESILNANQLTPRYKRGGVGDKRLRSLTEF